MPLLGLLNFYVDPSHVRASELFFKAVAAWLAVAGSVNYSMLLRELSWRNEP